jgi:hypothetical protein
MAQRAVGTSTVRTGSWTSPAGERCKTWCRGGTRSNAVSQVAAAVSCAAATANRKASQQDPYEFLAARAAAARSGAAPDSGTAGSLAPRGTPRSVSRIRSGVPRSAMPHSSNSSARSRRADCVSTSLLKSMTGRSSNTPARAAHGPPKRSRRASALRRLDTTSGNRDSNWSSRLSQAPARMKRFQRSRSCPQRPW